MILTSTFVHFISISMTLVLLVKTNVCAQCTPNTNLSASCGGGNGAVTNNQNINGGQTYWFASGTTATRSGINLNGGILRICGDLTITSINLNSGAIVIESGGRLNIPATGTIYLNGNITIINYGTVDLTASITMQNNNNLVVNYGTWNMGGQTLELNSTTSRLINNGTANIGTLYLQSNNGGVCVGASSNMTVSSLVNNGLNAITSSATFPQFGCVKIANSATLNQDLSNTNSLAICRTATTSVIGGATVNTGGGFGSASITQNCTSCAGVLLASPAITARQKTVGEKTFLVWEYAPENTDITHYIIQKWEANLYQDITKITCHSRQVHEYEIAEAMCEGYFRVVAMQDSRQVVCSDLVKITPDNRIMLANVVVEKHANQFTIHFPKLACTDIAIRICMYALCYIPKQRLYAKPTKKWCVMCRI